MNHCTACGACCWPLRLSIKPENIMPMDITTEVNQAFMLSHWKQISQGEAVKRMRESGRRDTKAEGYYYECDYYNKKTKLCTAHDKRPPICNGFPFYNREPSARDLMAFPTCGYWLDVPKESVPKFVSLKEITRTVKECKVNS